MTYPPHLVAAYDRELASTRDELDRMVDTHRSAVANHGDLPAHVVTFQWLGQLTHDQLATVASVASVAIARLAAQEPS